MHQGKFGVYAMWLLQNFAIELPAGGYFSFPVKRTDPRYTSYCLSNVATRDAMMTMMMMVIVRVLMLIFAPSLEMFRDQLLLMFLAMVTVCESIRRMCRCFMLAT